MSDAASSTGKRLRRLLPDVGDLAALGGLALLTHVLAGISHQAAEGFVGLLLLAIAAARGGYSSRRKGAD